MTLLSIIIIALVIVALIRVGITVEYSVNGLTVSVKAGPLSYRAYPRAEKPAKAEKKASRKARRRNKPEKEPTKKPSGLKLFFEVLPSIKKTLTRLRHQLLIKELKIHYLAGGDDAAKTALSFGAANAVFVILTQILDACFRVKSRDLRAGADFMAQKQEIYINVAASIAVWEAVYVFIAIIPALLKFTRASNDRKDVLENGEALNKRHD